MSKFITLLLIFSISDIFSQTPNWTAKFMLQGSSGDMDTVWIGCSEYGAEGYQDTLDVIDTEFTGPVSIRSYDEQVEDEFGFGTCTNLKKNIKGFLSDEIITFTIYALSNEYPSDDSFLLKWDTLDLIFNEDGYHLTYLHLKTEYGYLSGIDNVDFTPFYIDIEDNDTVNEFINDYTELFPLDTLTNCSNGNWALKIDVTILFNSYPVTIRQESVFDELKIYPNPTISTINLQLSDELKDSRITIFNIQGEAVLTYELDSNQLIKKIDVSNLLPGVYFTHIYDSANSLVCINKFVKL